MPEESISGNLARALRARFLQNSENRRAARTRPRSWFAPQSVDTNVAPEAEEGCDSPGVPSVPEGKCGASPDEARRAKRRRAAQQRQQRMLDDLKKRQAEFITGAQ